MSTEPTSLNIKHTVTVPYIKLTGKLKDNHRITITDSAVVANFIELGKAGFEVDYLCSEDGQFALWQIRSAAGDRWFGVVDFENVDDGDEVLFALIRKVIDEKIRI